MLELLNLVYRNRVRDPSVSIVYVCVCEACVCLYIISVCDLCQIPNYAH